MDKLCRGSHPNMIEVFRHGRLRDNSVFYYIDMELCDCNLDEYIQGRKNIPRLLSWTKAIEHGESPLFVYDIMRQMVSGLKFIHDHDEVHRDFNPQNVLYSSRSELWKIADFGLTSCATTTIAKTTQGGRGKQSYRAPELLREPKLTFNKKVDIWALGCILYELITSRKAFESDFHVFEFCASPTKLMLSVDWLDEPLTTAFSSLIAETIQSDYRKRPSADSCSKVIDDLFITHFPMNVERTLQPPPIGPGMAMSMSLNVQSIQHFRVEEESLSHGDLKALTGEMETTTPKTSNLAVEAEKLVVVTAEQIVSGSIGKKSRTNDTRNIGGDDHFKHDAQRFQLENSVALEYLNMGRFQEAEQLYVNIVSRCKSSLGLDHPNTLMGQHNLAGTYVRLGRYQEAEQLYVDVVNRRKSTLGLDNPDTLMSQHILAVTYINSGRYQDAVQLLEDTVKRRRDNLGANHSDTLLSQRYLATCYNQLGRGGEASLLLENILEHIRMQG